MDWNNLFQELIWCCNKTTDWKNWNKNRSNLLVHYFKL